MRVMLNVAKGEGYLEFEDFLRTTGIRFAQRHRVTRNDIIRTYIVDSFDFYDKLVSTKWIDSRDTWFEVTACNKQYISEHRWADDVKSLGSMCQVPAAEAMDYVFDFGSGFNNWYLIDTDTGVHWIAADRNPNRVGNHTSPGISDDKALWPRDPRCPEPFSGVMTD